MFAKWLQEQIKECEDIIASQRVYNNRDKALIELEILRRIQNKYTRCGQQEPDEMAGLRDVLMVPIIEPFFSIDDDGNPTMNEAID